VAIKLSLNLQYIIYKGKTMVSSENNEAQRPRGSRNCPDLIPQRGKWDNRGKGLEYDVAVRVPGGTTCSSHQKYRTG
jgi:hypothetical protein